MKRDQERNAAQGNKTAGNGTATRHEGGNPAEPPGPCLEETPPDLADLAGAGCLLPDPACHAAGHDEDLEAIFAIVKARTGHDFSSYKSNTVMRRNERRMAVNDATAIAGYVALLREDNQEAHALCQDILIGVTGFFRDPEAFALLRREVIPRLCADRSPDEPLRIWHACCATGEEVYSMAMLIREYLGEQKMDAEVLIFATDIDEIALAQARSGLYGGPIEESVGEERLKRFFTRIEGRWQVTKQLREMVVFAHHSLIKDPPFSRLDLLVCRNFLIYLNPDMQKRLISLFHQVLKPGRFLFLGTSETVERNSELFAAIDQRWKIFERREGERRPDGQFPFPVSVRKLPGTGRSPMPAAPLEAGPGTIAEKLLMERYSPPCVVVNEKYEVVHVSTRIRRFLEVPLGEPTRDVLRMAREELRPSLRAAIYKVFADRQKVAFRGVRFVDDGAEVSVNVQVEPLEAPQAAGKLALVLFEQAALAQPVTGSGANEICTGTDSSRDPLVHQLEEQLRVTHEQLQATSEQLETSHEGFMSANEELMSINEEFQSANEELQSINEELETSKEELQALNEELNTVNAELHGKVEELDRAYSDMENLITSSGTAALFLDRRMNIKGFTPAVAAVFNLIRSDIGRPFRHFAGKIDWPSFTADVETVLAGLPFSEREAATLDRERSFLKRITPYRSPQGSIDGIVVSLIDITERKRMEDALKESEQRVRLKLDSILSPEGEIGNLELGDIIDARTLQSLVEDFYEFNRLPMALIDLKGKILVGIGWQDVCTRFHRGNPDTCRNCIESDVRLSAGVPRGEYRVYKCKNNMWDVATPIMIGDRHFGNLFMGQFFFDDEPLDYELFRSQAGRYGFDEKEYLAAIAAVPRLSRKTLNTSMSFFMKLADTLSKLSYSNLKLARSLSERDALMASLGESEERLRFFIEYAPASLAMFDTEMRYMSVSRRWLADYGLGGRDIIGESHYRVLPGMTVELREAHRRGLAGEVLRGEADSLERNDGSVQSVRWEVRPWYDAAGKIGGIVIFSEDVTEIKKAEEILRRYELLARHSRDIILFLSRDDGSILDANAAARRSYGYSREELLALTVKELRAPNSLELTESQMVEADAAGILFETSHRRRDGSTFPVEVSSRGATIGGVRTLISVIRDITERRLAGEELRRAHDELEKRVRERTDELAATVDILRDEIAERQRIEASLLRLNRLYSVLNETDKAIVRVTDRASLFRDFCRIAVEQGGFLLSWVGLLDQESGEIRREAACGATGYLDQIRVTANEEPSGTGPTGLTISEGSHHICNDFLGAPETRPWHDQGRAYGIRASASVAVKEEGRVIGALTLYAGEKDYFDRQHAELVVQLGAEVSFALDNLAREERRQKAEQALREETLERLRTVEALRDKEKMLLQQNRLAAMGEMINNIAHQWRQPLNVVGLLIQKMQLSSDMGLLKKDELDSSVKKAMGLIHHMSQTIDDFRNFFQPDKDRIEFNIHEVVARTISLVEDSFKNQQIGISTHASANPVTTGFPNEYCQVLLNILMNARDALGDRQGGDAMVAITISKEGERAVVTIADNAGGIAEDLLGKIFEPYFTTKGPDKGTGVGLFMSKVIIENNMGGRLTVRNTDDGAEFRIEV